MLCSRRVFLRETGLALGAAAFVTKFGALSAMAQTTSDDYRALVCIVLHGGNDGYNTVIPLSPDEYATYASIRPNLRIPEDQALRIDPRSADRPLGLHPSLAEMHQMFQAEKLAVVCNIGTLLAPIDKNEYRNNPNSRPPSLFDHRVQENTWQDLGQKTGWGQNLGSLTKALNSAPRIPMMVNVTGESMVYLAGTDPYITLQPGTSLALQGFQQMNTSAEVKARYDALRLLQERMKLEADAALVRVVSDNTSKAIDDGQLAAEVLGGANIQTPFPNTSLGQQLLQIAKIIKAREGLGTNRRQIFYAALGGFDTHAAQLTAHPNLLRTLSQAMAAFYNATAELGVASKVTTFTLSEFGRTAQQNTGDPNNPLTTYGTDHAWGSVSFVMGGGVRGGEVYGRYPSLVLGGPEDVDVGTGARGRILPTTSVDQYAATLVKWFGVDEEGIRTIIPNIARFSPADLGFMYS